MQNFAPGSFIVTGRYHLASQIETLISEFRARCSDLEREIEAVERRSNRHDPRDIAYPPLAAALRARAETLRRSIADLETNLCELKAQMPESEHSREIAASEHWDLRKGGALDQDSHTRSPC